MADEFVADGQRHRHGLRRPVIPVVDVQIGSADGCAVDLDAYLARSGFRNVQFPHCQARSRLVLDQCTHLGSSYPITPCSSPAWVKAATARPICSGAWAADIWVLIRAMPSGTTG